MNLNPILLLALDEIYSELLLLTPTENDDFSIPFSVFCEFTWEQFQASQSQTAQLLHNIANDPSMKVSQSLLKNVLNDLIELYFPVRQPKKRELAIQSLPFFEIHSPKNLLMNLLAVGLGSFGFSDTQLSLFLFDTSFRNSLEVVFARDDPLTFFDFDLGAQFASSMPQQIRPQIEAILREPNDAAVLLSLDFLKDTLKLVCNTRTPLRNAQESILSVELFALFVETGFVDRLTSLFRNILEPLEKQSLRSSNSSLIELFTIFCSFFRFERNFSVYQISLNKCNLAADFVFKLFTSLISTLLGLFIAESDLGAFKALVAILEFSKKIFSRVSIQNFGG